MGTMYFVLGMLSIIAAAIVSVLVWGIVKISKQQQRLDHIKRMMEEAPRELNDKMSILYRDMDDRTTHIHRRIDENNANMSHEYERIYNHIADARSYTDSRIDKVLGTTSAKQVIKG
jgi:Na+-transporting NADH:ubiquinone oxidoreductase subunit NqrC